MSDLSKVTEEKLRTLNISEEEKKSEKGEPSERTKDNGEEAIARSKDDAEETSARSKDDGEETSLRSKDNNEPVENEQPEYTYRTRNSDAKNLDLESEDSDAVSKILLTLSCFINPQLVPSQLQASLT